MEIYEKIFTRLDELHISQLELSKRTGIATSTISDWKKKRINPQADKLVKICRALEMSVIDLLCQESDYSDSEKRLLRYYEMVYANGECKKNAFGADNRSISIICDENGNRVVLINDKKFKGL